MPINCVLAVNRFLASSPVAFFNEGKRLYGEQYYMIEGFHYGRREWTFLVPGERFGSRHEVGCTLTQEGNLVCECECPDYYKSGICMHIVAAAFHLREEKELQVFEEEAEPQPQLQGEEIAGDVGWFSFNMEYIDLLRLQEMTRQRIGREIHNMVQNTHVVEKSGPHHQFLVKEAARKTYHTDIAFDGGKEFKMHCTCGNTSGRICIHIFACFYYLDAHFGRYYFSRFKDFTKEKKQALKEYGLTPEDSDAALFQWGVDSLGKFKMLNKPKFLQAKGDFSFMENVKSTLSTADSALAGIIVRGRLPEGTFVDYEIGFLLNFTLKKSPHFGLEPIFVRQKERGKDFKKMSFSRPENWSFLQPLSDDLYRKVISFSEEALNRWIAKNVGGSFVSYIRSERLPGVGENELKAHLLDLLKAIWPNLEQWPDVYVLKSGSFSKSALSPVKIGLALAKPAFYVSVEGNFVVIRTQILIGNEIKPVTVWSGLLFEYENTFYLPESMKDMALLEQFDSGLVKFHIDDKLDVVKSVLLPLQKHYRVDIDKNLNLQYLEVEPKPRVFLAELNEEFLLVKPQFDYEGLILDYDEQTEHIEQTDGAIKVVRRNKAKEESVYEYLRSLHPKFSGQRNNLYYYLKFDEVMRNGWFLNMISRVQEQGLPVYGIQNLRRFKYNTNAPKFKIEAGSGLDWFDVNVAASWGKQEISMPQLKKAIQNQQGAILLDDGTLGVIPEEWISRYGLLLRMAREENGSLKVSKLHFSVLDELADDLKGSSVLQEIEQKKKLLLNFDKVQALPPPQAITAKLRPYQLAGFHWLQMLDEIGWGGCLADDMGLGKTLQTITFFQYLKEKKQACTQLVVCPTSLIFNWEKEIEKFCPGLKFYTYYGSQRSLGEDHFEQFDVVLTSYSLLRRDIRRLSRFKWEYVILDESQTIKNPHAQITKAVGLLGCHNRIALSGTPVQNNTSDLFAQFNFLNPGLLGSYEFFKTEFSNPIDKNGDKNKTVELRKLIYPFMLRRTKEQVAKDLPDKTEVVLWCTMGREQRALYEGYKDYYRNALLKRIDEEGMGKAGIYILEGLLKLRQICDHPRLIDDADAVGTASVKTDELLREISENTGDHKLLIFSQFTSMLSILADELKQNKISFCYLDGRTPPARRQKQVDDFQNQPDIKLFLISLKAGGVGLNLTAADYVYLIDPWWNPAAEQQAIDRTHRIGQKRKIFAYKMICKDSVEEKILTLQQKKKELSAELVSEEAGFVKKLSRDDVAFLFS